MVTRRDDGNDEERYMSFNIEWKEMVHKKMLLALYKRGG